MMTEKKKERLISKLAFLIAHEEFFNRLVQSMDYCVSDNVNGYIDELGEYFSYSWDEVIRDMENYFSNLRNHDFDFFGKIFSLIEGSFKEVEDRMDIKNISAYIAEGYINLLEILEKAYNK